MVIMDIYLISIYILAGLAIFDLVVGVSNDAVNFLNSSIGSRVAPRHIIMIIASLGMLAGVTFSSGMMEVARKGIFHPKLFYMPELIAIFLAVMLTDILLLDLFNTFGLPTSTTVSIVFELLGAAVAVSLIKIYMADGSFVMLADYINTGKALMIISGILLSVVIAFFFGAVVQFFTRLIFTFDYQKRLKRYGGIWGGLALSMITYFILIKGSKGASFMTPDMVTWIKGNATLIFLWSFIGFGILFQLLVNFTRVNILKPIVLIGTFALAMAFAANDLVNFIGVPLAGLSAYSVASAAENPLTVTMAALQSKVPSNTYLLLLAGTIMVITLWLSKKARTVTRTEVDLGRQDEGLERFSSSPLSRFLVRMVSIPIDLIKKITPEKIAQSVDKRFDACELNGGECLAEGEAPSFDLLRASVNLMVASAVVSYATSHKLPLSTTYVTFMVAMGASLADQAWGRESAVYRVTGVLTVVGGWFVTALAAFTVSSIFATAVYFFKMPAVLALLLIVGMLIWKNYRVHFIRKKEDSTLRAFSLKEVTDAEEAIKTSFQHAGNFLKEVRANLSESMEGLLCENRVCLKKARNETKKIQLWANVIIANIFKTLYILQSQDVEHTKKYLHTIRALQEIAESHRDLVIRAYHHIENLHAGLTPPQKMELTKITKFVEDILSKTADMFLGTAELDCDLITSDCDKLNSLVAELDRNQVKRIQNRASKTRLSILFYGFLDGYVKISDQTRTLVSIYKESLEHICQKSVN